MSGTRGPFLDRASSGAALFFFDLVCGDEVIRDDEGVEARDLDQALAEARSAIAEIADEMIEDGSGQPWEMIVRDETGVPLRCLPITE
jgi:hypothetical protein